MDRNNVFINDYPLQQSNGNHFLGQGVAWQPLSPPEARYYQKDDFSDYRMLQFPPETPVKRDYRLDNYYEERRNHHEKSSPTAVNSRTGTTGFMSAIPYARSSHTVKRKLNYENESKDVPNVKVQKTYFPFEFVGRATRDMSPSIDSDMGGITHPTMIAGHARRSLDVNGSVFQTFNTTQPETPITTRKARKAKPRRPTQQAAVENHIRQIRRKHAEFNWNINEPEKKTEKFNENIYYSNDLDSQRVPSPFVEKYNSPSLYSLNETQFNPIWMQGPQTYTGAYKGEEEYENTPQYVKTEPCWSETSNDFPENTRDENTQAMHLYPF